MTLKSVIHSELQGKGKKKKITAVYWVLGNIPAHHPLPLEPLLKNLVILERKGVSVSSLAKNVKGTVQCAVTDNVGARSVGGFIESFSGQNP